MIAKLQPRTQVTSGIVPEPAGGPPMLEQPLEMGAGGKTLTTFENHPGSGGHGNLAAWNIYIFLEGMV